MNVKVTLKGFSGIYAKEFMGFMVIMKDQLRHVRKWEDNLGYLEIIYKA